MISLCFNQYAVDLSLRIWEVSFRKKNCLQANISKGASYNANIIIVFNFMILLGAYDKLKEAQTHNHVSDICTDISIQTFKFPFANHVKNKALLSYFDIYI